MSLFPYIFGDCFFFKIYRCSNGVWSCICSKFGNLFMQKQPFKIWNEIVVGRCTFPNWLTVTETYSSILKFSTFLSLILVNRTWSDWAKEQVFESKTFHIGGFRWWPTWWHRCYSEWRNAAGKWYNWVLHVTQTIFFVSSFYIALEYHNVALHFVYVLFRHSVKKVTLSGWSLTPLIFKIVEQSVNLLGDFV